jgi:transposase
MLNLANNIKVWVCAQKIDMRKGSFSLAAYVATEFKCEPKSGQLFVFFGQNRTKVKILYWDRNGYALWGKTLALGKFRPPKVAGVKYTISSTELNLLLEGIDLTNPARLVTI